MIRIRDLFYVSNGRKNREAVERIERDGEVSVRVDFYTWQVYGKDKTDSRGNKIPAFNATARFFGKKAEWALEHLYPGRQVLLSGNLVQTFNETDGRTYTNNEIWNADYELLLPSPRSSSRTEESDDRPAPQAKSVSDSPAAADDVPWDKEDTPAPVAKASPAVKTVRKVAAPVRSARSAPRPVVVKKTAPTPAKPMATPAKKSAVTASSGPGLSGLNFPPSTNK